MLRSRRVSRLAPLAAVAAVVVAAWGHLLAGGETLVRGDYLKGWVPASVFVARAFARGQLPQWNDAVDLGVNAAANPNFQIVYPPGWLRVIVSGHVACDVLLVSHLVSLGVAGAVLSRRLGARGAGATLGGIAIALSGCVVSTLPMASVVAGASWLAWTLVFADSVALQEGRQAARSTLGLACALAMVVLAGEPTLAIAAGWSALFFTAFRSPRPLRGVTGLAAALPLALALAAALIVPTALGLGTSARAGGVSGDEASLWSLHPLRLLELLVPRALGRFGDPASDLSLVLADTGDRGAGMGPAWGAAYLSTPVVLLAGYGARHTHGGRKLVGLAGAFVLLALGRYTPLYAGYRAVFVVERLVRYPEKYLVVAVILLGALAGVGLSHAFASRPRWLRRTLAACAVVFGATAAAVAHCDLGWLVGRAAAASSVLDVHRGRAEVVTGLVLEAALCGGFALLLLPVARRVRASCAVAVGLLAVHLVVEARALQPSVPRALVHAPSRLLAPAVEAAGRLRGMRPRLFRQSGMPAHASVLPPTDYAKAQRDTGQPAFAVEDGLGYAPAYESGRAAAFAELVRLSGDGSDANRVLSAMDVRWVMLPQPTGVPEGMRLVASDQSWALLHNDAARPRAFVASRWRVVPDAAEAMTAVLSPGWDPGGVSLEGGADPPEPGSGDRPLTPCRASSDRPEHVVVECAAAAPSYAVLLDAWAPGWSATVDGAPAEVLRADGVVRAVRVAAGAHRVEYTFRAPGLSWGIAVSCGALLGLLLALWRTRPVKGPRGGGLEG